MSKFHRLYNKKVKYIYADCVSNSFTCNAFYNVTYGNRAPSAYCQRWPVYALLRGFRFGNFRYDFIPNNEPNEAEVIRGLYLYLRYQYNHARGVLTKMNKELFHYEHDLMRVRTIVKQARVSMLEYKRQYENLYDAGVYTYLELVK
jgi:hypothetical protein